VAIALLVAVVALCVLGHVFHDQAHRRLERNSARFLDALIASADRNQANTEAVMAQLTAHREEVQGLLQRIQAPELAVIQHQQDTAGPDESYPLTDEETARIQEQQLALERIERMERDGVLS
jgi:hypothetical protein